MTARALAAFINDQHIGELREVDGLWAFQYSPDWLGHPQRFALSPHLPLTAQPLADGASARPVQWYFDNLLPEEAQRTVLAADAKLDAADAFALLTHYGAESAGSLTLLPPKKTPQPAGRLRALPDAKLSERILKMSAVPLTHLAAKRMSLAGAQHKLAVVMQSGELFEPAGALPSTHILKPDHPRGDYPHSVINEWFVMTLAQRLGLNVPEVHRRYVPQPVYLVNRFDRQLQGSGLQRNKWRRLHAIDACQLLGIDRVYKYQGSMDKLATIANACRSPALARTRLFAWLVFNLLTGNGDAHLKNLSFMVSDEGVQLAPHYDLLSTACYDSLAFDRHGWPGQTELAWPVSGVARFAGLGRGALLDAGGALSIHKTTAARLFGQLHTRIAAAAKGLCDEVEAANQKLLTERPARANTPAATLAATFAGELRCLRNIVHGIIPEMVARLR